MTGARARAVALALVVAVGGLALAAGPAAAHPIGYDDRRIFIADDPPPPPPPPPAPKKPKKPLPTELGFRFGATTAGPDKGLGMGLQGGLALSRSLHLIAEYEYVFVLGREDDDATAAPGSLQLAAGNGHRGRLGLRVNLADATLDDKIRFYADGDATIGVTLLHGPAIEDTRVPAIALGLRLGYELLARTTSPARTFDFHLLVRLVRTEHDTGMMMGVGMEWGR